MLRLSEIWLYHYSQRELSHMRASELIAILQKHPDYLVQIGTSDIIGPVRDVYTDCFDEEEGHTYVIEVDEDE